MYIKTKNRIYQTQYADLNKTVLQLYTVVIPELQMGNIKEKNL